MISRDTSYSVLKDDIIALEGISAKQPTDYNSLVIKQISSNNQYDYSVYIPGMFTQRSFILEARTVSGANSAVKMKFFYTWDMPDVMSNAYNHTNMPGIMLNTLALPPTQGVVRWSFRAVSDEDAHTLYVKVMFSASDDLTWTFA